MNDDVSIRTMVETMGSNIVRSFTDYLPRALMAIAVLVVGWLFAKIVQKALQTLLARIHFDTLLEKVGVDETLKRVGLRDKPSRWLPKIIYYLILVFIFRMASQAMGLQEIADAINTALAFVPNVAAALIIVLIGNVVGQFAGRAVAHAADQSGIDYSAMLGRLVSSFIIFVVMILAIAQLKINMQIVNTVVLIIFGAFGLSFALSFGLGTREITRNIVAGFYARKAFRAGDEVEIDGQRGVIKSFTPLMTLIERDGRSVALTNSVFVTSTRPK